MRKNTTMTINILRLRVDSHKLHHKVSDNYKSTLLVHCIQHPERLRLRTALKTSYTLVHVGVSTSSLSFAAMDCEETSRAHVHYIFELLEEECHGSENATSVTCRRARIFQ